jgi:hypothetical protein
MSRPKPLIIDGHTHAWPDQDLAIVEKSVKLLDFPEDQEGPHNFSPRFHSTIEALTASEDEAGVDGFLILAVSSLPERCRALTRWVTDQAEKDPRIIPFGSVHPLSPSLKDDLQAAAALPIFGLKLHSLVQRFDPLSPEAMTIYQFLAEKNLPLLMDSMSLPGCLAVKPKLADLFTLAQSMVVETAPGQIAAIAQKFPDLRIIAAHLGCLHGWERLAPLYDLDNVWFDLAYIHRLIEVDRVMEIIRRKGAGRIIYGSDAPYRRPKNALNWCLNLPLPDAEKRMILAGNLLDLLGQCRSGRPTPPALSA